MRQTKKLNPKLHPFCQKGHQYALDVVSGNIVAGIHLKGACLRYLRDIENTEAKFYMDWDEAERYLRNVQNFEHVIGNWPTKNIVYEPWQNWLWMNIIGFRIKETNYRRFRVAHVEVGRGNAKMHHLETRVPTPDGMKLWKEIEVGSRLYDRQGRICRVTGKTQIQYPQAYEIEFSDGTKDICGEDHLWFTSTKNERGRKKRHGNRKLRDTSQNNYVYEKVRTTKEIAATLTCAQTRPETNHSVKNTMPVIGEKKELKVHPYVLGYWLGNGSTNSANLTCNIDDAPTLKSILEKLGYSSGSLKTKEDSNGVTFKVDELHLQLKDLGLLGDKHIPESYFLSTIEDRLELVRGLLDSDGTINPTMKGQVTFTNKNGRISEGLDRLLCSLGYKVSRSRFKVQENNNFKSDTNFYRICFYPRGDQRVFSFERKYSQQISLSGKYTYVGQRYIVGAKKLEKKYPMFCVQVDSPDQSYLVTESYIPTHNSAMASQCVLYFLGLDENLNGNQISTVATKKDQARIVLDSARAMAKKSESFRRHTGVRVLAHTIVHPNSNSIARPMSADHKGLDGLNDILAVCDELHAMDRDVFEVITSGMSKRKDSLTLCITTAGQDIHSVGFSQSSYAKKICLSEVEDDTFFAVVYTLDEGDDWADESVWIKANPGLGVSVDIDTMRSKVEKALVTPADIPNIKIKHMNMWISEAKAFFSLSAWDKCADPNLKLEDFRNERCRLGLDLASHIDIASIGITLRKDGKYYIFDKSYLPEDSVQSARNVLYDDCIAKGYLFKTPGAAINYEFLQNEMIEISKILKIIECLYDPWNATETAQKLSHKIEMVKVSMNVANFSEPMKKLDSAIRSGKVVHNGSPLLRWCLGNVVAKEDHNGNVYPRKSHEKLKIDPIIAILMGIAGWIADDSEDSIYESTGIRTL